MKKFIIWLANIFNVDITTERVVIKEVEKEIIKEVEKQVALQGTIEGDVTVKGNLLVEGSLIVNGEVSCHKIK